MKQLLKGLGITSNNASAGLVGGATRAAFRTGEPDSEDDLLIDTRRRSRVRAARVGKQSNRTLLDTALR